ncbi:hypothetical protein CINTURNW_1037 [Clostridium intestinale URNW]|uniref:Bacteriophage Gp15 protein n=2 Tax=Clostridium intestinale TaxID=36845 RepID=U2N8T8_9CLOT|nr:hypothetical protein CINTURNW_1037 [Clostridium intestinale URNW]
MQYNIRLRSETEMSWSEFTTLLKGIMPETPLGQIVSIRAEENKDMLQNFTQEQHKIRNEWREKQLEDMTVEETEEQMQELQELFAKMFG